MPPIKPVFVVENLEVYEMTTIEAWKLEDLGFLCKGESANPDERELTALVWDDLGLTGDRAFALFDVILGRGKE